MTRARSDLSALEPQLVAALRTVREALRPAEGAAEDDALTTLEALVDVSLRLMRRTPPSVIRDCAKTAEIGARLDLADALRPSAVSDAVCAAFSGPLAGEWRAAATRQGPQAENAPAGRE